MTENNKKELPSFEETLLRVEKVLNYPEDAEEYRLVKCMENGNYDEVTKVYPFFGTTPWYTPLMDDRFLEYFNNPANEFGEKDENGSITYSEPLFNDFTKVIRGFFAGQKYYIFKKEAYSRLPSFYEYLVYKHYVITCPEKEELQYISKLIRTTHRISPENLTAEELAARIIYGFWVRFGITTEIEDAKSGKTGYYLTLMKEKSNENNYSDL